MHVAPVLAAGLFALVATPAALAHATLVATVPVDGSIVAASPARVTLRFSEPVETALGAVRVYDEQTRRMDEGGILRPSASGVGVALERHLRRGTYTVTWRVISADGHPVHGGFVFSVGAVGSKPGGVAEQVLEGEQAPSYVGAAFWIVRFLSLLLVLGVAGGSVALAAVLRDADEHVRGRLAVFLGLAASILVLVSLAGIVLQGAEAAGYGVGRALHGDVVSAVLDTRFGQAWLARASLSVVVAAICFGLARRGQWALVGLAAVAVCLIPTVSVSGHASVGSGFELAADLVHLGAAAVWTGGLVVVGLALAAAVGETRWRLAERVVPRFSAVALVSVAALVAAGIVNGYLEVRAWRGLWETIYGRLILAKVGLLLVLLAFGAYNRLFVVPRLGLGTLSGLGRRRFVGAVAVELALMTVVVGLTASLVVQPPATAFVKPTGPVALTTSVGPYELNLVVDPAGAGPNEIHLYLLQRSGRPANVAEAMVMASYPATGIGPIHLGALRAGPGHYTVPHADLPIAGDWRFAVTVRRGEFDQWTKTTTIPIRKDR